MWRLEVEIERYDQIPGDWVVKTTCNKIVKMTILRNVYQEYHADLSAFTG